MKDANRTGNREPEPIRIGTGGTDGANRTGGTEPDGSVRNAGTEPSEPDPSFENTEKSEIGKKSEIDKKLKSTKN